MPIPGESSKASADTLQAGSVALADGGSSDQTAMGLSSLHSLLLDQLPVGVFQKDKEGRFIFVNAWFCHLKKATADQFLGKTASEVAGANWVTERTEESEKLRDTQLFSQGASHHDLIMKTGRRIESEEFYVDEDGNEQVLHAIKGPVVGADGTVIGSQGVLLDITERKKAEAQLASERDLLGALLNFSPDSIYFKDRESRFLRCSSAMAPLFNLSNAKDLIGKRDADFCREEHAQAAFHDEQEIIRTGGSIIGKTEKETWLDGRVTWALTSKMPLRDAQGQIIGTFGISKDLTDIKNTEAKLEELHRQLLRTSRQAGMAEVATSVLHNVGNVLNSANVSSSLLLDNARKSSAPSLAKAAALLNERAAELGAFFTEDPKGRQFTLFLTRLAEQLAKEQQWNITELESLRRNIEHIKEIVAMQQSYAKVSGVVEIISATDLVEDALRMNAASLARHGVAAVREYSDSPPMSIDKHKVLQILINLIRNAKFACDETGREDKQIIIKVSNHDGMVSISVVDNGIGIPPENLTRVFGHGFTTRKGGHGFGLHSGAIAAKEMGGSLTARSDGVGQGATFTLTLPIELPRESA